MDGIRTITWRGNIPGVMDIKEMLTLEEEGRKIAKSIIRGIVKEVPVQIFYKIVCSEDWNICSVSIICKAAINKTYIFNKNAADRWSDENKNIFSQYDACTDIDISLTPFTNTLHVNRLKLSEKNSGEISVLYFDLINSIVKPVKQSYTNIGDNRYIYENFNSGFNSEIEFDADGFVNNYPDIWKRINPAEDNIKRPD